MSGHIWLMCGNSIIQTNDWFQNVKKKTIGCMTECIGNVNIAALHIVPFLMSKLPTSNIKAALSDALKVTGSDQIKRDK